MAEFLASIGMEVHAELATASKMFCRCPVAFGGEPNTRVCPVCLGLPGALPVPNWSAIEMVIRTALALNCEISLRSSFQRKNYFYPDIPKGYQISQYQAPFGHSGYLDIPRADGSVKRIRIRRVHLEEDTGKLMHLPGGGGSGIDYNRSGVPLMEIVTDFPPDIENAEEAKEYLVQLRQILLYLGVCDGKMEEGSLRCEPNVSVRPRGSDAFGTKTELKNLNSFRSVLLGSKFEIERQTASLLRDEAVHQETRGWNEAKEESFVMRVKEAENDYRYFTDPDLAPFEFSADQVEAWRATIPELPLAKSIRFQKDFGLTAYDAGVITAELEWADFFEDAVRHGGDPKAICNQLTQDFAAMLNNHGIRPRESNITPKHVADLVSLIATGTISGKIGKEVFAVAFQSGALPSDIVRERGLTQVSDEGELREAVRRVLDENGPTVQKFKGGNVGVKGFFVGQTMKATQGRANPEMVQRIVDEELAAR